MADPTISSAACAEQRHKTPAAILASNRAWKAANPKKHKASHRVWRRTNKEKVNSYHRKRRIEKRTGLIFADNACYEAYLREMEAEKAVNKAGAKDRLKKSLIAKHGVNYWTIVRHKSPQRILRSRLGARMQRLVLDGHMNAKPATFALIGCTGHELRIYIESLFLIGMSWDNRRLWHIDHIRPCNTFDLTDPKQQAICFHHTNLRPLWATQNLSRPKDGSDIPPLPLVDSAR